MKTASDPRHQKRIDRMQKLFSYSFRDDPPEPEIKPIIEVHEELDTAIQQAAPEWPIDKIAKIDLAILRLSVFEMTKQKLEPQKVIIDEAVELAKAYGNENSSKFVNGVLGTILKKLDNGANPKSQIPMNK